MLVILRRILVLGILTGATAAFGQESACLKGLKRERAGEQTKLERLQQTDSNLKIAQGGSAALFLACVYKFRGLPSVLMCGLGAGGVATVATGYKSDIKEQIEQLEDSLILLTIYEESKEGRGDSQLLKTFMSEHEIEASNAPIVLKEIELLVDKDMVCNSRNGRPNLRLEKIAEYVKAKL